MKIVFVYVDAKNTLQHRINFGISFLSAYLKKSGFATDLVYYTCDEDYAHLLALAGHDDVGIVGFSSVSSSFPMAQNIASRLKHDLPHKFMICGGPHVSIFPEAIEGANGLDAICVGFGEEPLLDLARSIAQGSMNYEIQNIYFKKGDAIIRNALRPFPGNLDNYYPEDRGIFYKEFQRKRLAYPFESDTAEDFLFARGCPFQCSFCSNHILKTLGTGKYITFPAVETVVMDILQAKRFREFHKVSFHDDILTLNKPWFRQLMQAYSANIGLPFICNLRIGTFDEEDVLLLKKANCELAILGIESGNDAIRNEVLRKNLRYDNILEGFRLLHRHGIQTVSQNMVGIPGEDFEKFYDTVKINASLLPNRPVISVYFPYPGTRLFNKALQDGLIESGSAPEDGGSFVERKTSVLKLKGFPNDQVNFCADNFLPMILWEYLFARSVLGSRMRKFFYGSRIIYKSILPLTNALLVVRRWLVRCVKAMKSPSDKQPMKTLAPS